MNIYVLAVIVAGIILFMDYQTNKENSYWAKIKSFFVRFFKRPAAVEPVQPTIVTVENVVPKSDTETLIDALGIRDQIEAEEERKRALLVIEKVDEWLEKAKTKWEVK